MDPPIVIFYSEIITDELISSLISNIVPPTDKTLSVEELILCTKVSRSVQRKHTEIPRPPNCFMIYRKNALAQKEREVNKDNTPFNMREFSKEVAAQWKTEPDEVVNYYTQIAEIARIIHSKLYPHYKYKPRRPGRRRRMTEPSRKQQNRKRREEDSISEFHNVSSTSTDIYFDGRKEFECAEPNSDADEFNHLLNNMNLCDIDMLDRLS